MTEICGGDTFALLAMESLIQTNCKNNFNDYLKSFGKTLGTRPERFRIVLPMLILQARGIYNPKTGKTRVSFNVNGRSTRSIMNDYLRDLVVYTISGEYSYAALGDEICSSKIGFYDAVYKLMLLYSKKES